ncbi:protein LAZ1 isoform X3 [Cryptomeria japonica]|uniref:protein LAZ1 isoform X3 n=1 Tax=Cryptomeria japonica TaxID=3369 RepID=UPI0025ACBBEC|nr:protein LAZ1 isoform X3 [Cryptomeria japonica]
MVGRAKWNFLADNGSMAIFTGIVKATSSLFLTGEENTFRTWAIIVAGTFVLIAVCLSMFLIFEHLTAYKNPEEQKFLIGVILMVPCYAVESFVSLVKPAISVDCEILRDCYEAFAMYCFGRYLIACLGGEERTIEFMKRQGRSNAKTPLLEPSSEKGCVKHPFPLKYFFKPWKLGQWFFQVVKFGIVQYMIIKTFCALLAVVLETFGVYCEGEFKVNCGYPYLAVVLNFSQSWALYCLVQFYTVTKDELEPIKPLAKFLMFKSIVFLTWWQGVAIAVLYSLGLFKGAIAQGLQSKASVQDFIICIEHRWVLLRFFISMYSPQNRTNLWEKGVLEALLLWQIMPL